MTAFAIFLLATATGSARFLTPPQPSNWIAVASLEEVPTGRVRLFPVLRSRLDAWKRADHKVGDVFLHRDGLSNEVVALANYHSWGRARVEFEPTSKMFVSCCWGTRFDLRGKEVANEFDGDMPRYQTRIADGRVWILWTTGE